MKEKIREQFYGRHIELRERIFRIFLIIGTGISAIAILEEIFLHHDSLFPVSFLILGICFLVALVATFKYHLVFFSSVIVGVVINLFYFPIVFFANGTVESGATIWFIVGLVYIFLMFSGKSLAVFLVLTIFVDVGCYVHAYLHPDWIGELGGTVKIYIDSAFSVIAVGVAVGLIFVFQRKVYELEREINERQKEELEKAANSKNTFFAKMSHEIRTPINTIIGLNQMNLREELPEEVIENSISIQNAGDMLLYLVNDILDMSQLENRKMKIVPGEYETREFFNNLVDMLQLRIKNKGLDFYIDIDRNLPTVLYGDEKRLTQVMINILTNAVKYTNEGSVTLTAKGEWEDSENLNFIISVADTGSGIRKEDLDNLFDYFTRLEEKRNAKIEGSGLGLSISKQLMDLMEGQITVDSIYTKGSTFTISLKQKVVDASPIGDMNFKTKKRAQLRDVYRQSFEAPEARILVVDDDQMNHVVLQKLLRATKVQLDFACGWTEALEKTKKKYYHVILLDHMMPDKDGVETLHEIRTQENGLCREVPALCLTGNLMSGAEEMYRQSGFQGYLTKPIQGELLEAEILQFIPEEVIEYCRNDISESQYMNGIYQIGYRKRKICITTDCVCDLSEEYISKYNIRQIYLYIETEHGRFCDTKEMDSNNLFQYLTNSTSDAIVKSASVEDYEAFFADALTEADDVIHVSLASNVGKSYERAIAAAECFDHVHVVDSGHISGGQAIVVLHAAQLVQQEQSVQQILTELDSMKERISSSFLLPSASILYQSGYVSKSITRLCNAFNLHPIFKTRHSSITVAGLKTGSQEKNRRKFIRQQLHRGFRLHTDYIIVNHAACSVKEMEFVKKEIQKFAPFSQVIIQKASVSTACSAGVGSIGLSFYRK